MRFKTSVWHQQQLTDDILMNNDSVDNLFASARQVQSGYCVKIKSFLWGNVHYHAGVCTAAQWILFTSNKDYTQTHTHTFNGLFSRTTWVSWHQKGKPFWILLKQEMINGSGISWTICKSFAPHSRQITTLVPHHSFFTGRMLFLMPNQQCQSTEGKDYTQTWNYKVKMSSQCHTQINAQLLSISDYGTDDEGELANPGLPGYDHYKRGGGVKSYCAILTISIQSTTLCLKKTS